MELDSFNDLERQVSTMLERFKTLQIERDELAARVQQLEADNFSLRTRNADLRERSEKSQSNSRDRERDRQIKAKVEELLAKLEGF